MASSDFPELRESSLDLSYSANFFNSQFITDSIVLSFLLAKLK